MSEVLWLIDENVIKIIYKNKAKSVLKKLTLSGNTYFKYPIKNKSDGQIGYACVYKGKSSVTKSEQFAYLKDVILKAVDDTKISEFSLMGTDPEVVLLVTEYFKSQYISGAELMTEIFLMHLNKTLCSSKICFVIDTYISLLEYHKLFDLFKEACVICENGKAIDKYAKDIYLNTATSLYVTNNPNTINNCDIVFYSSLNKKYIKYLQTNNIILDVNNIINDYCAVKLVKPPNFMDFYTDRINGILIKDMTINASCAQHLLKALSVDFNMYYNELKLI